MQGITSDMVKAIRANFLFLLVIAALVTALPLILPDDMNSSGADFALSTIVGYFLHRQVLYDFPMPLFGKAKPPEGVDMPKDSIGRFMLVSLLFTVLFAVPAGFVAYQWASSVPGRFNAGQFVGMMLITGVPLLWILLSVIGTALPAAASKLPFSFSRAFQAGRKTGLIVALQLVIFPGLTFAGVFAVALLVQTTLGQAMDSAVLTYVSDTLLSALFLIPSVMTVVVLVRAFKTAYPPE